MKRWIVAAWVVAIALPALPCELTVNPDLVRYGDSPAVFVMAASSPIAGRSTPDGFRPAYALTPGVAYRVESDDCGTKNFALPSQSTEPSVEAVYPLSDMLPENTLRFYIRFSEPMREGGFLSYVRLVDKTSGQDLTGVFFDNFYELWTSDRRQITLIVDPGRVKTGLESHEKLGRAFVSGRQYSLSVQPGWRALGGGEIAEAYTKVFSAGDEDRSRVDPATWHLSIPAQNTSAPLKVDFREPVDHVSVSSYLQVRTGNGEAVYGTWSVSRDGEEALFQPNSHWETQSYELRINARFEDVAANNLNGAFDHEIGALKSSREGWVSSIPFVVSLMN